MAIPAIWMNGRITQPSDARISIFDHGLLYGDGIFEGIRFYGGRPFRLGPHLSRLERSAVAIELALPYARTALAQAVDAVIADAGVEDGYLRLIVTRGEGDLGLDRRSCKRRNTILAAAPLRLFDDPSGGVSVIFASTRQAAPDAVDRRIKSLREPTKPSCLATRDTSPREPRTMCSSCAAEFFSRRKRATARSKESPETSS